MLQCARMGLKKFTIASVGLDERLSVHDSLEVGGRRDGFVS